MTEQEAMEWLSTRLHVPRETLVRLANFVALLETEAHQQNLIAASTLPTIWARHIVDSAQLLALAPDTGTWLDLGSGAGFPGLIVAAFNRHHVTLVESRRKRVEFLERAADILHVNGTTTIAAGRAETLDLGTFDVISARAFAPLDKLLGIGERFATTRTRWLLPKGRNAVAELDAVRRTWQGAFRIEPSVTDPDSAIIVAEGVRRKGQR